MREYHVEESRAPVAIDYRRQRRRHVSPAATRPRCAHAYCSMSRWRCFTRPSLPRVASIAILYATRCARFDGAHHAPCTRVYYSITTAAAFADVTVYSVRPFTLFHERRLDRIVVSTVTRCHTAATERMSCQPVARNPYVLHATDRQEVAAIVALAPPPPSCRYARY